MVRGLSSRPRSQRPIRWRRRSPGGYGGAPRPGADKRPALVPAGPAAAAGAGRLRGCGGRGTVGGGAAVAAFYLVLLVTSRTVLRLRGEHELRVLPPSVSPPGGGRAAAERRAAAAVRLFVERAYAAAPGFEADGVAEALAGACRRLEGLAPAIGLAAIGVWRQPPQELLSQGRRFGVLPDGEHDLPERQRTLPDTVAWRFGLRSADAPALFARPGAFPGPSPLPAVEAVAGDGGSGTWEPGAGRASDGPAGVAASRRSRPARRRLSSLLTEQRQLCSNSICARGRLAAPLVWQCSAREPSGGEP
jgi:hypothetical protein